MACRTDKLIMAMKAKVKPTPELIKLITKKVPRRAESSNKVGRRRGAKARGRTPTLAEAY